MNHSGGKINVVTTYVSIIEPSKIWRFQNISNKTLRYLDLPNMVNTKVADILNSSPTGVKSFIVCEKD